MFLAARKSRTSCSSGAESSRLTWSSTPVRQRSIVQSLCMLLSGLLRDARRELYAPPKCSAVACHRLTMIARSSSMRKQLREMQGCEFSLLHTYQRNSDSLELAGEGLIECDDIIVCDAFALRGLLQNPVLWGAQTVGQHKSSRTTSYMHR